MKETTMLEEDCSNITVWLQQRASTFLTVGLAKELSVLSKSGWFVMSHGTMGFVVGKFAETKFNMHHILKNDDGKARYFPSSDAARRFLSDELGVMHVHTFEG